MTEARLALDTNILAYAEGVGSEERCAAARRLIAQLIGADVVLPAQTLGELYRVLHGKAGRSRSEAADAVLAWRDAWPVADSTWSAFESAFDCGRAHGLQIWDALILSVAGEHGCRLLLSEDLQPGFVWRGVTVVNPFVQPWPPALEALLG